MLASSLTQCRRFHRTAAGGLRHSALRSSIDAMVRRVTWLCLVVGLWSIPASSQGPLVCEVGQAKVTPFGEDQAIVMAGRLKLNCRGGEPDETIQVQVFMAAGARPTDTGGVFVVGDPDMLVLDENVFVSTRTDNPFAVKWAAIPLPPPDENGIRMDVSGHFGRGARQS